jgi:ABC-type enterobactin transport system permease subunit
MARLAYCSLKALKSEKGKVVFMKIYKKRALLICIILLIALMFSNIALAGGTGDVAGAIEGTWGDASQQIKTVVNKVVFPAIDLVLAVFFFAKLGMAYFDYRKHGQFEWAAPAILFACLVFTLTAPLYIWTILGI